MRVDEGRASLAAIDALLGLLGELAFLHELHHLGVVQLARLLVLGLLGVLGRGGVGLDGGGILRERVVEVLAGAGEIVRLVLADPALGEELGRALRGDRLVEGGDAPGRVSRLREADADLGEQIGVAAGLAERVLQLPRRAVLVAGGRQLLGQLVPGGGELLEREGVEIRGVDVGSG